MNCFLRGLASVFILFAASLGIAGVVSPGAQALVRSQPNSMVDVVFFVEAVPSHKVAALVKREYAARIKYFGDEAKGYARTAQVRPLTAVEVANRAQTLFTIDSLLNERGASVTEAIRNSAA